MHTKVLTLFKPARKMLSFLLKKKVSESQVANHFVQSIVQLVDDGFPELVEIINYDPEFERRPNLAPEDSNEFLLIVLAGNISQVPKHFSDYQDVRIMDAIYKLLSESFDLDKDKLKEKISSYQKYFSKINHPSKNTLYAMSKAVFYKYNLNDFQDDYFRKMKTPNPIFLARLHELMENFQWDWSRIQDEYKIVS